GEDKGRLWHIPLNSNWQGLPDMMTTGRLVIPGYAALAAANAEAGALRFNDGNTAHYICDYQGLIGASLVENIADLDAISRLQLVQEQQLLAEAGRISYASLVALMKKWPEEKAFIVLSAWANVVRALARFVDQDKEAQAALDQKV
ncbi:aminopeptidase, partial [Streptococcus danieliae]|nr:aminopeptidase [Streptococcus danieliae]